MSKRKTIGAKYLILILCLVGTIGLDQWTKLSILDRFRLGETFPVIVDFFNITYVQNKGAAFGFLAHADPRIRVPFFVVVPVAALVSIAYVFRKIPAQEMKMATALSLVISGAIGNLIDRLSLGFVVDFLDFHWRAGYHFPAFNVADSAICVGVAILMLDLFLSEEEPKIKETRAHVSRTL